MQLPPNLRPYRVEYVTKLMKRFGIADADLADTRIEYLLKAKLDSDAYITKLRQKIRQSVIASH